MESLERLASSIAQVELLLASLKRENRDLGARLASAVSERLESHAAMEARIEALDQEQQAVLDVAEGRIAALDKELQAARDAADTRIESLSRELQASRAAADAHSEALNRELQTAREEPRSDPEWETRGALAEHRAAELESELSRAQARNGEERGRLEALIRQLEAQVWASHGHEQLPVASAENLEAAHERERLALAAQAEAQERAVALAAHLKDLQARLDAFLLADDRASREIEALKEQLVQEQERGAELERGVEEREEQLAEARTRLAGAAKLEAEQTDLKRQKREAAAFSRERHALRRKVEELLITLESVRLG